MALDDTRSPPNENQSLFNIGVTEEPETVSFKCMDLSQHSEAGALPRARVTLPLHLRTNELT